MYTWEFPPLSSDIASQIPQRNGFHAHKQSIVSGEISPRVCSKSSNERLSQAHAQQVVFLNNQPIAATEIKQLGQGHGIIHRLILSPSVCHPNIPSGTTTVIVKQQKDGWEEEFQNEKEAYDKLQHLQGTVIPELFGQGSYNGLPALILSNVVGPTLRELATGEADVEEQELRDRLQAAFGTLSKVGALVWDPSLDNAIFCNNGKIMLVDLEHFKFRPKPEPWETEINLGNVGNLMSRFRDVRDPCRPPSPLKLFAAMERVA